MNTKYQLSEIDGYPQIICHIMDISQVVAICLKAEKSYGFTVSLDDGGCINVTQVCDDKEAEDVYAALCHLRLLLLADVYRVSPGYPSLWIESPVGNTSPGLTFTKQITPRRNP